MRSFRFNNVLYHMKEQFVSPVNAGNAGNWFTYITNSTILRHALDEWAGWVIGETGE